MLPRSIFSSQSRDFLSPSHKDVPLSFSVYQPKSIQIKATKSALLTQKTATTTTNKKPAPQATEKELKETPKQPTTTPKRKAKLPTQTEEYFIEKVLEKKIVTQNNKNITFYKVKWWDYPLEEATWEPYYHLSKCKEHIEDFEKKQQAEKAA